jgi:uncharacterized RDD family membrane protein YckC
MVLHEVLTAEKVPITFRVAGVGARFLAWLVDALLMVLLGFMGLLVASVYGAMKPGLALAVGAAWLFVLNWGYFLLFEWLWHGQTPGKRLLGIRVIQWQGTAISFYQAAVRNLVRVVDSLPWVLSIGLPMPLYAVGFVAAVCNRLHRRVGDLAAGTLVVHADRKTGPIRSLHDGTAGLDRGAEGLARQRLSQLGRPQKEILLDLCVRREQLRVQERAQLFGAAADYCRNQLGLVPTEFQSDEKFVLNLVALLNEQQKTANSSV